MHCLHILKFLYTGFLHKEFKDLNIHFFMNSLGYIPENILYLFKEWSVLTENLHLAVPYYFNFSRHFLV